MNDLNKQLKYVLGLDIGVASIGWSVVELNEEDDPVRIVDLGARIFKALDNDKGKLYNEVRREKRGLRRIITRRKERLRRIYRLCKEAGLYDDKQYIFNETTSETIYDTKIRGLSEKLTGHELTRCLIHYAKNRGFKSNRKGHNDDKDGSKIQDSINKLLEIQEQKACTITPAIVFLKQSLGKDTFKNGKDEYIYFYDRLSIEKEATQLIEKQMEYGLVDETFKNEYLDILLSQRDFSEGPGATNFNQDPSPYAVSFEQAFGKCKFTNEDRISRGTPSYELFVFLQKLLDFRYYRKTERKNKLNLTLEQIHQIYNQFLNKPKLEFKYADIVKSLKLSMEEFDIVNLPQLSKKQYIQLLKKYTEQKNKQFEELSDLEHEEFQKKLYDQRLSNRFAKFPAYSTLYSKLKINDIEILDAIGTILTFAKTDKKIDEYLAKEEYSVIPVELYDAMKEISLSNKEMRGSGSVSLSLTRKLIQQFLEGKKYSEAMEALGYHHSQLAYSLDEFPTVKQIEEQYNTLITSPNVKHVLVLLRKLYKAIERKYGKPTYVRIELAREMNKSFSERKIIENQQFENRVNRQAIKNKLATLCNLNDRYYFSNDDILRYELYEEQNGICMYTGEVIELKKLLSGEYEVDHIIPYSISNDDSKQNKVLVVKAANQLKGNRVPMQWLTNEDKVNFEKRVKQSRLSNVKKDKLLVKEAKHMDEFSNRDLAITSHVSRIVTRIFTDLLKEDKSNKQLVQTSSGGHTSALRYFLGLNKYTHSFVTKDYNKQTCKALKFKIDSYDVSSSGLNFTFKNDFGMKNVVTRSFQYKKNDKNSFINQEEELLFNIVTKHPEIVHHVVEQLTLFADVLNLKDSEIFPSNISLEETIIRSEINKMLIETKEQLNKKDRNSHFHHMVDATLIAILNDKMKKKINKHRLHHQILKERFEKQEMFHPDTGELMSLEQYIEANKDHFKFVNQKLVFETPYPEFVDEMIIRIFERDEDVLKNKISKLSNYKNVDMDSIKVRYPSHYYSTKVSGSLHAETLYSIKDNVAIGRSDAKSLNLKDLELIYDKDGGSKNVYETLKKWIQSGKKGEPFLPNGRKIKKVKLIDPNTSKLIKVTATNKSQAYAGIAELARILVFSKEADDNLYFAQIDNMRYLKYKMNDFDYNVVLWKGQGENNKQEVNLGKVSEFGFKLYQELIPGEIISLQFKKDKPKIHAKVVGFSSGMFEIGSIVGDNTDIASTSIMKPQQTVTVSTIKSIEKVQIDLLGNLIE